MLTVVGFGANLGDVEKTLDLTIQEFNLSLGQVVKVADKMRSEPLVLPGQNPADFPEYLNTAILLDTADNPQDLLRKLLAIEKKFGRDRSQETQRWQSRVIDLDIILYEHYVIDTSELKIPHPEMSKRDFVLKPLVELWPEWIHPLLNKSSLQLYSDLISSK